MLRKGWGNRVVVDIIVWVIAAALCILWRWAAEKMEVSAYWSLFGVLAVLWIVVGMVVQLYRSYKETWFWQSLLSVIADAGILIGLCWWILPQLPWTLSPRVA